MPKCSLNGSKTGIITLDDFLLGAFPKQTGFYDPGPWANFDCNHNVELGNATTANV